MKVFMHGLGQEASSWRQTLAWMGCEDAACPALTQLVRGQEMSYRNLYQAFCAYCDGLEGELELCGLSVGAMLALNYAMDHPERVTRLAVIAPQVKPPRILLAVQHVLFRLMPEQTFAEIGLNRQDFIRLCATTAQLDFSRSLSRIACTTLVLCGEKDKPNRKAALQTADGIAGARLEWIPGAGHEVNLDAPRELAGILNAFFKTE